MHDHQSYSECSDNSMDIPPTLTCDAHDLRIVLLGVSGAGKSSVGNAILGREAFKESTTRESEKQSGRVEDRNISIIDTPGFFNDHLTDEELQKQMMKILDLSDPGPHVFLLIINLENFEKDERNIVEEIEEIFGAQALDFTIVLFIGRERMTEKGKDFILGEKISQLVNNCREQYEINSTKEINQTHIKKLIMKIDELFKHNDYYKNKMYSVSQTSSTKERKKLEKQEKEKQKEVSQETFEMNTAMEEGATHAVFATHEYVRQRKKTTEGETNLQGINTLDRGLTFSTEEEQKQEMSQKKRQTTEEEHPTQAGVSAAPPLPAALQLDLATRIKDKLKKEFGGRRLVLLKTICLVLICVLLLATIIDQHITIKAQRDQLNSGKNTIKAQRDQLNSCSNTIKAQRNQLNSCNNTIKAQRDQLNSCNNKVEERNQIINSLQEDFTELTAEKEMCYQFTKRIVMTDLRIMVVGKTGAGKSASGNTILGEKVFEENVSFESVTKTCLKHQQKVKSGKISVIDTPGLFDTNISKTQLKNEIAKCVSMSVPGPHVFLLVVRLDVRFTDEEKKTVKWIQENFGEKAADYSIILFTRGDQIDKPIEEFLTKNRQIEELVRQCKDRYHVFNNKDKNPSQVNKLLDKIVRMVMENGGGHYTNEMYREAQKRLNEENERRKLEEEEKMSKEAQKRQREEDERRRLEEEEKINKEVQKRLREENERRKLEEEKKKYKEAQDRWLFMFLCVYVCVCVCVCVCLLFDYLSNR